VGDLAYSGDFIDDIRPRLEELGAQIVLGKITVPTVPANTGGGTSEEGA
jgi:hypothetical protein